MGLIDSGIEGLATLLGAAVGAEFQTAAGLANFVLILTVLGVIVSRPPLLRAWNLLLWSLELLTGSAPEQRQPVPQLPSFEKMLVGTVASFALCVMVVAVAADLAG